MQDENTEVTLPMKIVYVGIALLFLMLGIVGLVLPIIPGLLFLAIAMLLLARVSVRFDVWSRRDPRLQTFRQRMSAMSTVKMADRIKLAGWMTLEAFVQGTAYAVDKGRTLMEKCSRNRLG